MKTFYLWTSKDIKRIEVFGPEDTAKKPEIPRISLFGKVHQKYLDARRTNHGQRRS